LYFEGSIPMKKRILIISVVSVLFIACATTPKPIYPTISNYIGSRDVSKYRTIAVLPFADAPTSPQSGQIVQGLASQIFAQQGFTVVERARLYNVLGEQQLSLSGIIDTTQAIRVGKLLGVNAIVVGEVGQYSVMQRHTDTTYFPLYLYGQTTYIPVPGKQWSESYVSLSLRVVDVETSQLIYSGVGQYDVGLTNPPQQLAEYILQEIIARWARESYQPQARESYQTQSSQQPAIVSKGESGGIFRSRGEWRLYPSPKIEGGLEDIQEGDIIVLLESTNDDEWVKVKTAKGSIGFVKYRWLKK